MSTRFYLPSHQVWPYPAKPAFDAAWDDIITDAEIPLGVTCLMSPRASPNAAYNTRDAGASNTGVVVAGPADILLRQYVSPPLNGAQTIDGTVKGQHRCFSSNAAADAQSQMLILVVSEDCATVRGTALAAHTEALSSEWPQAAGIANRKNPLASLSPVTLSSVSASDRDRIVIQIGARKHEAGTTSRNYTINFGTASANDLAEDETDTDADRPWIEFSASWSFHEEGPRVSSLAMMGCGA